MTSFVTSLLAVVNKALFTKKNCINLVFGFSVQRSEVLLVLLRRFHRHTFRNSVVVHIVRKEN